MANHAAQHRTQTSRRLPRLLAELYLSASMVAAALLLTFSTSTVAAAPAVVPASTPSKSASPSSTLPIEKMSIEHREFLRMAAPLLQETEREVFLELQEDFRRDAFIQRFWRSRDPFPDTPRNELRERLQDNYSNLREELDDSSVDEAAMLLLHGDPSRRFRDACELLQPLNIWYYRSSPLVPAEFYAVFRRVSGDWSLWSPSDGIDRLLMRAASLDVDQTLLQIQQQCSRGQDILSALTLSMDLREMHQRAIPTPDPEWAQALLEASAQRTSNAHGKPSGSIQATTSFIGRRQSRVVVQTDLVLSDAIAQRDIADGPSSQLILDGEVVRDGRLFDSFRYRFEVGQERARQAEQAFSIERYLRPGDYRLLVQITNPAEDRSWNLDQELVVPPLRSVDASAHQRDLVTAEIDAPELIAEESSNHHAESNVPLRASLRLRVPNRELLVGPFRAEAITDGPDIRRVAFELDGERVLSKARPPYSVELDAGRVPRAHQLVALAFNGDGVEVARDEVTINAGPRRFSIRLIEPRRGATYEDSVRAVAEVSVPPLEKLESVEFFLNEQRVATLYQKPFALPIAIPSDLPLAFVQVVGRLESGQQTEDLVFVNSPNEVEYLDVDLVEVYTSVTNRRGLPMAGLTKDQFQVFEDGQEQTIDEFRQVKDLPIHACVLFDTSTSMIERLEEAKGAAHHFFELVLEERDRACLMTFNDVHELVVDFTHSPEVLAGGLASVVAEGETALYDSLIHTLYLFNGMRGKRAIILLSDGADSKSEYRFNEVLEFARRSEVTIHVIGVDIDNREMEARMRLSQLARETGGRTFFIDTIRELRRVYDLIEEDLRSQYLLAYQSDSTRDRSEFREIKVKVRGRGLKARALSGYYP